MTRKIAILVIAALAVTLLWTASATATVHQANSVYYNYYGPVACDGTSAALYVSPRPVPAYVGHTYIPYAPLRPHEYLYRHSRSYLRCNGRGGVTMTNVRYGHWPQPLMRCYPLGRGMVDFLNQGHH